MEQRHLAHRAFCGPLSHTHVQAHEGRTIGSKNGSLNGTMFLSGSRKDKYNSKSLRGYSFLSEVCRLRMLPPRYSSCIPLPFFQNNRNNAMKGAVGSMFISNLPLAVVLNEEALASAGLL
ncbi:hypothetical protein ABW19_dt0207344 [Dactylella cylindrospora]|nr:hypothetical protein ABW19_dt0207344 [Dactylella cylindrospora]